MSSGSRRAASLVVLAAVLLTGMWLLRSPQQVRAATAFSGTITVTMINGAMDVNGDGAITTADDATDLLVLTDIIDGLVDCDGGLGADGDQAITAADGCAIITKSGVIYLVVEGVIRATGGISGPLGGTLALTFTSPSVTWTVIDGFVDSNGNGQVTSVDCHTNLVGDLDVAGLSCGENAVDASPYGRVGTLGAGAFAPHTCSNNCFFGKDVQSGIVLADEIPSLDALRISPSTTTTAADGVTTMTYTVLLDSAVVAQMPTIAEFLISTTLGRWRDNRESVIRYLCVTTSDCGAARTLVLETGQVPGKNTVVATVVGFSAVNVAVTFTSAVSGQQPSRIATLSGEGFVSAKSTSTYPVSPTDKVNLHLAVVDAVDVGVNGRLLVVTTDKGAVKAFVDGAETCTGADTAKSVTIGPTSTSTSFGAGWTAVVVCPSFAEAGEVTLTVTDAANRFITRDVGMIFARQPVSEGITIGAPRELDIGQLATITVTAQDAAGNPIARDHTIELIATAGVSEGQGACVVTPGGVGENIEFSPPDSASISATLVAVGPVTSCLVTAKVTGGTITNAAAKSLNIPVVGAAPASSSGGGGTSAPEPVSGEPGVALLPPARGLTFAIAGTSSLETEIAAQPFTVESVWKFNVPTQTWLSHVVDAPDFTTTLTSVRPGDVLWYRSQ